MEIFFTILILTLVVSLSGVAARIIPVSYTHLTLPTSDLV